MVGFNKTLNILIFLLAGASVFFGFILFEKREILRRRGDEMAKFINEVSGELDLGSGTAYQKDLDFKNRYFVDPLDVERFQKGKELISLYHNNFKKLQTVLGPFKDQAVDVIAQRDELSKTLHTVLVDLEIPNANEFEAPTFMAIKSYGEQDTKLLEIVTKLNDRDNAIFDQIGASAGIIGKGTIEPASLKHLVDYTTPLSEFAGMVQALKTRSDTYATSIHELCGIFGISKPSLDGEDYNASLDTIRTEMQGQKDEFDQTVADLATRTQELADANEKIQQQIATIEARDKEIDDLKEKLSNFVIDPDKIDKEEMDLERKLEGTVVRVNNKWGFVVIDLGLHNKMLVGLEGKNRKEREVPLPEDKKMDVARGSRYLGQIHIVKVAENCAIADIVPETNRGQIEPGDKVFFARENKTENQDIIDEIDEDTY